MKINCVIYCRVSSSEQEETGYSLPAQEKLLKEYAERKELGDLKIFSVAESASGAKQRQVFEEMINFLKKNNVSDLLVEKVDRLTRNLKDAVLVNDWLDSDENRKVHFVKQNLVVHKNAKSDERFRWDIEIVLAKKYISNLSEEVKKGQKEKLAQGWLPTKPPIGYKTIGEKGKKIHVIDPEKTFFIKKIFEDYASGKYSMKGIIEKLYKDGYRTRSGGKMVKSKLESLLNDPFYYGAMRWKDILYTGKHEPIINKELFDKVQSIKSGRNTPSKSKHNFVFRRMIKCSGCNGTITGEVQKEITYYHCNHYKNCPKEKWATEAVVEEQIFKVFDLFKNVTKEEADRIRQKIKSVHAEEIQYKENAIQGLQERYNRLQKRLDVLYEDRLDEKITTVFWEAKKVEIDREQAQISDNLKRIKSEETKYYEIGLNILDLAYRAREIYENKDRTPEEKRMLISYLFSSMNLLGEALDYKMKEPVLALSKRIKNRIKAKKIFEPKKALQNNTQTKKEEEIAIVLRDLDSNQEPID